MNEKAFLLYKTQCKSLLKLSPEERGDLLEKIIRYVFDGEEPDGFDGLASEVLFDQIRDQIDRDTQKYKNKCDRNRKTAIERENRKKELQNNTNVNERVQTCTNVHLKDKDTDKEKDKDTNKDTEKESDTDKKASADPTLEEIKQECKKNCPKMLPKARKFWNYYQGKGWPDNWKETLMWWAETELSNGKGLMDEQTERFNGERSSLQLWE